jgi:hypothetical protein
VTAVLPPGACLLHVGPYKTGSSSIQSALHHRRSELREQGVLYAGSTARARRPGWAVIGVTPRGRRTATMEEWLELAEEVRAAPDLRVCVSTEDLARVEPEVARRVVADLGPDRIQVLTVVRRLDRLLPSQWQQRAQSFKTDSYDDYLHTVLDEDGPADHQSRRAFWASHDVGKVLQTWGDAAGADRVIAVVADEQDRALLPRTFEQLLGLPDGMLQEAPGANPSLSWNAVELLRRLNVVAEERGWPDEIYARVVREAAHEMKYAGAPAADLSVPRLPSWAADRVRELSEQRADALVAAGVRVVGDPDALRVVETSDASAVPLGTVAIDTVVRAVKGVVAADERTLAAVPAAASSAPGPARRRSLQDASARELVGLLGARAAARLRRATR